MLKSNSFDRLYSWPLRTGTVRRISNVVVDISAGLCQYRRMLGENQKANLPRQRSAEYAQARRKQFPISQPSQQQLKTYFSVNVSRRGFLRHWIGLGLVVLGPALVSAEEGTPGMKRRQDRRDDRGERLQKRDDNFKERRDDPIGVRGPERRNDRRDVRDDRRKDRRERVL